MIKNFTTIFCLILVLAATSCKKIDTSNDVNRTYISVINASSSLGTYNFYMNNNKANSAALPIGGVVNYLELAAGTYETKFTTASSTESVFSKALTLNANTVYSYFLIGTPGQFDAVTSIDVMNSGNPKASIRVANMTPDAESLQVTITKASDKEIGESTVINALYKSVSEFSTYESATYTIDVRDKTTNEVVATTAPTTLSAGKYYTILVRGKLTPGNTEHKAGVEVITNL